jgi:hypothetical protein
MPYSSNQYCLLTPFNIIQYYSVFFALFSISMSYSSHQGGDLQIKWDERDNKIYMTGPAKAVFTTSNAAKIKPRMPTPFYSSYV